MKRSRLCFTLRAAGLTAVVFAGCTSNPFGDDDIGSGRRAISGKVQLTDGSDPEEIYVWLETFNIGARTDNGGRFTLSLPPPSAQGGGGGIDGAFSLYFFVANYQLVTAQVATRGGEFIFNQGEINAKGELGSTKSLKKTLSILTQIDPNPVPSNYPYRIGVQVTLQAIIDSVTVLIPSVGGLLNAVLFRNLATGAVFVHETVIDAPLERLLVGRSPRSRVLQFSLSQIPGLTTGEYEVIPYILIAHDEVPAELFTTIAPDAPSLGPNYVKIPFRREDGRFSIDDPE